VEEDGDEDVIEGGGVGVRAGWEEERSCCFCRLAWFLLILLLVRANSSAEVVEGEVGRREEVSGVGVEVLT